MNAPGQRGAAPDLSIVIPCYNEEACVELMYARVKAAAEAVAPGAHEIVLVNDGSTDGTWPMLQALAARDPSVVAIGLARNHGHQLALSAGLEFCGGACVFILDADMQDPPECLGPMLAMMREQGADIVYGVRRSRAGEKRFKLWTAHAFYRLLDRMADVRIPSDTGDFRLVSRRALDALLALPERERFLRGMFAWVGFRQLPFAYDRDARAAGATKYPLVKMMALALTAITNFSTAPLRLASHLGLAATVLSLALVVYVMLRWTEGATVTGWPSIMAVVLMLGGLQLLVLGVIGEYLGKLFIESKQRPLYIVADVAGSPSRIGQTGHVPAAIRGMAGAAIEPLPAAEVVPLRPRGPRDGG